MNYDPTSILRPRHVAPAVLPSSCIPRPINGNSASNELRAFIGAVGSGAIYNAGFSQWPVLNSLTQWGIPGTITMLVGDAGSGKTFLVLQAMEDWIERELNPAVLFIEKDRRFHTHRLLAMLEQSGKYVDFDWLRANEAEASAGAKRNAAAIDRIGSHIWSEPPSRLTLGLIAQFIRERADEGHRVIVVDPITAASAGAQRWTVDDDFMIGTQKVLTETGTSLLLVTHAKKGFNSKSPSGHDQAGGAAFYRFSDTDIWVRHHKKPRRVEMRRTKEDVPWIDTLHTFVEIHKARHGRGNGLEIGFKWNNMRWAEQGIVICEKRETEITQIGNPK